MLTAWLSPAASLMMPIEAVAKRSGVPLSVTATVLNRLERRGLVRQVLRAGTGTIDIGWVVTSEGLSHATGQRS